MPNSVLASQTLKEPFGRYLNYLPFSQHFSNTISKTRLFKYIENFTAKNWKFSDKNSDIFQTSAQNIDCGYSLEPPRWGGSYEYPQSMFLCRNKKIMYTPVNPSFYYIKVGLGRGGGGGGGGGQNYIGNNYVFVMTAW